MSSQSHTVLPQVPDGAVWNTEEGVGPEIDLVPLLRSYLARWPLLFLSLFVGTALFYGLSYLMTPEYESTAVFLPPSNRSAMSDNPLAALWSTPNTGALYPGLLKSNSVVDVVLRDLNLDKQFKARDHEDARDILRKHTTVTNDTAGFYTLAVRDRDRLRAKEIADKYMEALAAVNKRLAVDQAAQEQSVYEQQLLDAKNSLEKAAEALAEMQESSGVVSPQSQTQAGMAAINELRAEITQRQVDLAAMRKQQTDESPSVVRMQAQIDALEAELATMERGKGGGAGAGLSAAQAPEANLEFMRLQRDVMYQQSLYEILTKQFESAQLQAISTPGVQIVDYPELPLRKATPRRAIWALVGGVLAFLGITAVIFMEDRYRVLKEDPKRRGDMAALANALKKPGWRV